jgi:hypothetical protein
MHVIRRLEEALCAELKTVYPGCIALPTRADADETTRPYIVVMVRSAREIVPGTEVYRCDLRVVLVSDIHAVEVAKHEEIIEHLSARLNLLQQSVAFPAEEVRMHGCRVLELRKAQDEQYHGDIFEIVAGASAYVP